MNKAVEIFGDHIYRLAGKNPLRTRKQLHFVYNLSGLLCKYFPDKKLLPSRQYLQWLTTSTVMKALRSGEGAAIVNLYLPCEVLHSMGINLMFPEGYSCYLAAAAASDHFIEKAEAEGIASSLCSYHKCFVGFMESGVMPRPEMVINTTLACDSNHLTFRRAADHYDTPHKVIDVPTEFSEYNLNYVADQLKGMVSFIEENTSFILDEKEFLKTIEYSKTTIRNLRDAISLRRTRSLPDEMNSFMLELMASHALLGTREAVIYSERFLDELRALPERKGGLRLVWIHTLPYWQNALRDIINVSERCEIVACDMTYDSLDVNLDEEDPYKYMAERLLKCSMNGPSERRLETAHRLAEELRADGIVVYSTWGCKQSEGISTIAKKYFEEKGYPVLLMDGDGCDAKNVNDGQTATRFEAFLELLENRK